MNSIELGDGDRSEVERKRLSILFCDLVSSTELSTRLDPEDFRYILAEYQAECARIVASYDGFVSDFRGDGIIIYFGFPVAREDDAMRAALCALDIVEQIPKLDIASVRRLQVRIGISTGLVVVGDKLQTGMAEVTVATGRAPYLAARLQALAKPDEVLISQNTYDRLQPAFECSYQGSRKLKGFEEAQDVWVLGRPKTPLETRGTVSDQPIGLVGRTRELADLSRIWKCVKQGHGRAVALVGEAGIGKTRLLTTFLDQLSNTPNRFGILHFSCSSIFEQVDYYPFAAQVARSIGVTGDDGPEVRMAKLMAYSSRWRERDKTCAHALLHLLGLAQEAMPSAANLEANPQDSMMAEALQTFVFDQGKSTPLIVVIEDLHWADLSTLGVLTKLVQGIANQPIMLVLTSRPSLRILTSNLTVLPLRELDKTEAQILLSARTGVNALHPDDVRLILEKSDGIPLFIEEIAKVFAHQRQLPTASTGAGGNEQSFAIPPNLQDLLSARLDLLGNAKRVAQIASLLGRFVDRRLLLDILGCSQEALTRALDQLVHEGVLTCDPDALSTSEAQLLFRHSLIQEAAYQSMLVRERRALHGRVLEMLESGSRHPTMTHLALLAFHAERAERFDQAIECFYQLAQAALSRSSLDDATANVSRALSILDRLSDDQRLFQECKLQLTLGAIAVAAKGYASAETGAAFRKAKRLSLDLGSRELLAKANTGLAMYHLDAGEVELALGLTTKILDDAHGVTILPFVNRVAGTCNFLLGDLDSSQRYLNRSLALLESEPQDPEMFLCGADLQTEINSWLSVVLSLRGRQSEAEALASATITAARELEHPYSLAYALGTAKVVYHYGGQHHLLEVTTDDLISLADSWGFPYFIETGRIYKGWILVRSGKHDKGLALMERALAALRSSRENYLLVEFLVLLADARLKAGRPVEAVRAMDEASHLRESYDVSIFDSEMLRMRARSGLAACTLTRDEAEDLLQQAVDLCHLQQTHGVLNRINCDLAALHGAMSPRRDRNYAHSALAE